MNRYEIKVSINDCPEIIGSLEVRERLNESKQQSSFDDQDNILRKAVDKIRKGCRTPEFDFYDPNEDDDNEKWVNVSVFPSLSNFFEFFLIFLPNIVYFIFAQFKWQF